jgi:hypothetical protein
MDNVTEIKAEQEIFGRPVAEIVEETRILDRGYTAVREMAKELLANGAGVPDILWHADQLWHEFKAAALQSCTVAALFTTGMYIQQRDADLTDDLVMSNARYADGTDAVRIAQIAAIYRAGQR